MDDAAQHLLQAQRVGQQARRCLSVKIKNQLYRLDANVGVNDHAQVCQQVAPMHRVRVQRHLARFGLGQVQDVIEQAQQGLCRARS